MAVYPQGAMRGGAGAQARGSDTEAGMESMLAHLLGFVSFWDLWLICREQALASIVFCVNLDILQSLPRSLESQEPRPASLEAQCREMGATDPAWSST